MNLEEAYREAQRRWGRAGNVVVRDGQCIVGTIGGDMLPNGTWPYGRGWTFEEAFVDSERRAMLPPGVE